MGGKSSVVIGYKYYLGMHMVICHGPVDVFQKIVVADRQAWAGNVTASQRIYVNSPELFGGRKKEGGIQGYVDVMMGEAAQGKNGYLQSKIGSVIPAFRGVLSVVLRKVYVCAMTQYPKPWAFKVKRIPGKNWYPEKAEIGGSANVAHVIYETLTNGDWGMGYPSQALDDASFRSAADTLFSEGLGVSVLLMQQDTIESFIYQMLGHCNGMLYTRPDNGKFSIKLLRDDYVVANLPLFDESNILKLSSYERPAYAEIVNEIVVTYHPQGGTSDDSVTVQDLASIQAQNGVISQSANYPGIDNATNAARLAMRDLKQKSTPLARVRLHINRKAWNLTLGSVFRFSWAEHGMQDTVFRVLGVNNGTLEKGEIIVDAVEDIFGLPLNSYVAPQPPIWTDPVQLPSPVLNRRIEDSTYFELANSLPTADLDALDGADAYITSFAAEGSQFVMSYEFWTAPFPGWNPDPYSYAATGDLTANGLLTANISETATTLTLSNMTSRCEFVKNNTYAFIGGECVRINSLDVETGVVTLGRGCLDTVCAKHNEGDMLWFSESGRTRERTLRTVGARMACKQLPRSGGGMLALDAAPQDTYTTKARHWKPYAPGNFKVNGASYPEIITGPLVLSWAHRDRTQQVVKPIIDHTAGNIGPELGVTYRVDIYRANGSTLIKSIAAITGSSWSWATENSDTNGVPDSIQRIKVTAVRAGVDSWQSHDITVERTGAGYNLGNHLGGI